MDKQFAISIAQSRAICTELGNYYQVKVTTDPHFYEDDNGGRYIINFAAMTGQQATELQSFFTSNPNPTSDDLTDALNASQLTFSIWVNSETGEVGWKPSKGEIVKISLDYVQNREGDSVLRIKSCAPLPVSTARTFTLNAAEETPQSADSHLQETEG